MTATKTKTKTKTKRATKKLNEVADPISTNVDSDEVIVEDISVHFNGVEYKPDKEDVQEITFLGTISIFATSEALQHFFQLF